VWGGRDLPFPVALDGGGEIRVRYSAVTTHGATTAMYGVASFPTTLIIGRDGKVLDNIDVRDEGTDAKVAAAVGTGQPGPK
jgi:peroxiredoxin